MEDFLSSFLGRGVAYDVTPLILSYLSCSDLFKLGEKNYLCSRILQLQIDNSSIFGNNLVKITYPFTLEKTLFKGHILFKKEHLDNLYDFEERQFLLYYWKYVGYSKKFSRLFYHPHEYWIDIDQPTIVAVLLENFPQFNKSSMNFRIKSIKMAECLIASWTIYPMDLEDLAVFANNQEVATYFANLFSIKNILITSASFFSNIVYPKAFDLYLPFLSPLVTNINNLLFKVITNSSKLLIYLIEQKNFDLFLQNDKGENLLFCKFISVPIFFLQSIKKLAKKNLLTANLLNVVSFKGETPLSSIFKRYCSGMDPLYLEILEIYLQSGADPNLGNKIKNYNIAYARSHQYYYLVDHSEQTYEGLEKIFNRLVAAGLSRDNLPLNVEYLLNHSPKSKNFALSQRELKTFFN